MPKIKVLLINSPIRLEAAPNCIPYGLATIAGLLRQHGVNVEIYDINALRPSEDVILTTLKKKRWDIVGVSGLITTYKFQKWLIGHLRAMNPAGLIVSGGGLATSCPQLLFEHTQMDVAVIGEGENTMLEICRAYSDARPIEGIAGMMCRTGGGTATAGVRRNIENLDDIPFPAWDLLPMEIYLGNPIWGNPANNSSGFKPGVSVARSMNIISSRGCPYSCNYCYHLFGRSSYRFRSPENIMEEMSTLVDRYAVDFIGFVDDNMMASENRLLAFCDRMQKKKLPLTWGCHGRVTNAKPDILREMARAGCVWIGYGIESGSRKILDAMNKRADVTQARQAIIETRAAGIYANTTFIFGYPGETLETIQETIDFKKSLSIECGSFFATPYPGTPLYEQIRSRMEDEEAFIASLGNATEFTINLTSFDQSTLFALKNAMDANVDVL